MAPLASEWLHVAGVIAFTTLSVTFVDSTKSSVGRAFALLLTAAQIASPAGWIYYLWFAVGPLASVIFSEDPSTSFPQSGAIRWPIVVALGGFLTPITLPYSLQRSALATLTAGSVYFWATLALWIGLIVEFTQGLSKTEHQPS